MVEDILRQVRSELGPDAARGAAALSHYLAAAVAESAAAGASRPSLRAEFLRDRRATIGRLYPAAQAAWDRLVPDLVPALAARRLLPSGLATEPLDEPRYRERVVHLALERLLVHPGAPPLLVSPEPDPEVDAALARGRVVAVLFDQPLGITHELYPLCTDAYATAFVEPEDATAGLAVAGVHTDWLEADGRIVRAIRFDPERDLFLEAPLTRPVPLAAALLLAQSAPEHGRSALRLQAAGVPHLNPHPVAALADDKWACYGRWRDAGVATPATCLLPRLQVAGEVRAAIVRFLGAGPDDRPERRGWVVQPRHGTEGEQVGFVPAGPEAIDGIARRWESIAASDDAILRPRVGSVCLASPDGPLPLDLRVHVNCDESGGAAESGYLLVAPSPEAVITSVGQGGRILPFSRLEADGLALADGSAVPWRQADLERAQGLAIRAARSLGPLGLAGVDLKLDLQAGTLAPCVLDLNPRPAGLLHADLFADGQAGIGPSLWRRVRGLLSASA